MTSERRRSQTANSYKKSAKEYLDDERFSRAFTVPLAATPGRTSPLTVSYSDYGHHHPDGSSRDNVVVICGPMLSCRYLHVAKDALAKRHGLRIIHPDRPGMGRTTAVPVEQRMEAWLQILPALLTHLGIAHVSLISQSGGAVYAASTLLQLRHLLHPSRPYVAFCAPWVDPAHSGAPLMVLTSSGVPSFLMGKLQTVNRVVGSFAPVSGFSSGVFKALNPWKGRAAGPPAVPNGGGVDAVEVGLEEEVQAMIPAKAYEEDMTGLGQEALFLMRRGGEWGDWADYDRLVDMVAARAEAEGATVKVRAYFAESDIMIGTGKGPAWFDRCWKDRGRAHIDYRSSRVPYADHDSILDLRFGVAEEIFREISNHASAEETRA